MSSILICIFLVLVKVNLKANSNIPTLSRGEQERLLVAVVDSKGFEALSPQSCSSPGKQWIGALIHDVIMKQELQYELTLLTNALLSLSFKFLEYGLAPLLPESIRKTIDIANLVQKGVKGYDEFIKLLKSEEIYFGYGQLKIQSTNTEKLEIWEYKDSYQPKPGATMNYKIAYQRSTGKLVVWFYNVAPIEIVRKQWDAYGILGWWAKDYLPEKAQLGPFILKVTADITWRTWPLELRAEAQNTSVEFLLYYADENLTREWIWWADLANNLDTDRDGVTDFEELTMGTDPLNPSDHETQSVSAYSECNVIVWPNESIQEVIDKALPGATICLEEGVWELNEGLIIRKSLVLKGVEPEKTTIKVGEHLKDGEALITVESDEIIDVTIENFTMLGDKGEIGGINIAGKARLNVKNCQFEKFSTGIYNSEIGGVIFEGSAVIENTVFRNNENSIESSNGQWIIRRNSFLGNHFAIFAGGSPFVTIEDNEFTENKVGIDTQNDGEPIIIRGNYFKNNACAVAIGENGVSNVVIQDNKMEEGWIGIVVMHESKVEFKGNRLVNLDYGVVIFHLPCRIPGTDFEYASGSFKGCIRGGGNVIEAKKVKVCPEELKFLTTQTDGCYGPLCVTASAETLQPPEISLKDCTTLLRPGDSIQEAIRKAPEKAIICLAPGTWRENIIIDRELARRKVSLTLRGSGADKTVIEAGRSDRPVIIIEGPGKGELMEQPDIQISIENLTITGARLYFDYPAVDATDKMRPSGIWIGPYASVTVQNCVISKNDWHGIVVSVGKAVIQGCHIFENKGVGILVSDGSEKTVIEDNTISKNEWGIVIGRCSEIVVRKNKILDNVQCGFLMAGLVSELWSVSSAREGSYGTVYGNAFAGPKVISGGNVVQRNGEETCPAEWLDTLTAELSAPTISSTPTTSQEGPTELPKLGVLEWIIIIIILITILSGALGG